MKFNCCIVTISLCTTLLLTGAAKAQEPPEGVYSLSRLSHLALSTAETIKLSENDLSIAQEDRVRALSVLMPRATGYGSYLKYNSPDTEKPDVTSRGIKLTQSFTLNGKELIALKMAEDVIEQSEFQLTAVKNDYLYEIATGFYRILSSERSLDIAKSDVKRLEKHLSAVKERLRVGDVTKTDLYRTEAELSGARTERVKAENGLYLARSSLVNLVPLEDDFSLSETDLNRYQDYTTTRESLKEAALKYRPEIRAAEKVLELAQKNLNYEKSAYWPSINLEGSYSDSTAEYDSPVKGESNMHDASIEAVLTFTLFDGGLRKAQIRQRMTELRSAELALSTRKKAVILDAESAWLSYRTAVSALGTLKDELKSAKQNFDAVTMQFQYGVVDSIDMMDANTLLVAAERKVSDAEFDLSLSILNMIRVRGDMVDVLTD